MLCSALLAAHMPLPMPAPVFLMSFGHCGIDWLHSLLDSHPQVLLTPTWSPYRYWKLLRAERARTVADMQALWMGHLQSLGATDVSAQFLSSPQEWGRFAARLTEQLHAQGLQRPSVIAAVHEAYRQAKGLDGSAPRVLVIHEHVCFPFQQIVTDFPLARFCFIVRDPRAALAGYFRGFARKCSDRPDDYERYFNMSVEEWLQAVDIWRARAAFGARLKLVKNEDLHADLEAGMRDLATWFGIDFDPILLQSTYPGGHLETPDSCYLARGETLAEPQAAFFQPERIRQRWQAELADRRDLIMIEALFRQLMSDVGYARMTPNGSLSTLRGLYYFCRPHRGPQRFTHYPLTADEVERRTQRLRRDCPRLAPLWSGLPVVLQYGAVVTRSVLQRLRMVCWPGRDRWRRYDKPTTCSEGMGAASS